MRCTRSIASVAFAFATLALGCRDEFNQEDAECVCVTVTDLYVAHVERVGGANSSEVQLVDNRLIQVADADGRGLTECVTLPPGISASDRDKEIESAKNALRPRCDMVATSIGQENMWEDDGDSRTSLRNTCASDLIFTNSSGVLESRPQASFDLEDSEGSCPGDGAETGTESGGTGDSSAGSDGTSGDSAGAESTA